MGTTSAPSSPDSEIAPLLERTSSEESIEVEKSSKRLVIVVALSALCLLALGGFMEAAPATEIYEAILCKDHYARHTIADNVLAPTMDCKIEPVQSSLALITGWKDTLDNVPGILLAVPYGIMADRYGRKPVYVLGLLGWLIEALAARVITWNPQVFPLWTLWITTLSAVIGGGLRVMISMLFTMIADVTTSSERTVMFSIATSCILISMITALTGTAAIMRAYGPWVPYMISISLYVAALAAACLVPETKDIRRRGIEANANHKPSSAAPATTMSIRSRLADASTFVRHNGSICVLLCCNFAGCIATPTIQFLMIYVPNRFPSWSFAQASTLISLRAFLYLILLLAGLPLCTRFFHHKLKVAQGLLDLRLAQISALLLATSMFIIGMSGSVSLIIGGIFIFSIGSAMDLLIRSVATTLVGPDHIAALYTGIAVVESIATFLIGPSLAGLFKWGMLLGNRWQGLPFFATGTLLSLASILILFVRLPKRGEIGKPAEESIDESVVQQEMYI